MELGRRGFLSALMAAGAAHMLPAPEFLVFDPERFKAAEVAGLPLMYLVKEAARELKAALGDYPIHYIADQMGAKVGQVFAGPPDDRRIAVEMTNQSYVHFALPRELEVPWREAIAKPAACALADRIKGLGLTHLTDLQIPSAGAEAVRVSSLNQGIALRGVVQYDIQWDMYYLRFDTLGGKAA